MLELKNINKIYKTKDYEQKALDKVDLKFRKHEFVAILGPSGSGKTTLLNIIGGLDRYTSGDLIINNKSTKKFKDKDWDAYRNNCIGFVFQNYNLISHISILENIEMGMVLSGVNAKVRKEKALQVLDRVGLKKHAHKKPNQLSGGQMQRVSIARAIVNDPDIILADEPTGALDSKTSKQIMDLIKEIANEELVIMVTHNEELAREYATRIITIRDGQVLNDSNPVIDSENTNEDFNMKNTSMKFWTALKLSFKNIITKMGRTFLTAFASSIGIIGIALILSLSNGFDKQIEIFEKNTLSSFPIMITEETAEVDIEQMEQANKEMMGISKDENSYTDKPYIIPYNSGEQIVMHFNDLSEEYINYVENIDTDLISGLSYYRVAQYNILNNVEGEVKNVTSHLNFTSLPKELQSNNNFISKTYDVLYGEYPKDIYDVVLMVDEKNRVETELLDSLGVDSSMEKIDFSSVVGKELKLIYNNDYYIKYKNIFLANPDLESVYNNKNAITLKIVGIVRPKEDNAFAKMMSTMSSYMGINGVGSVLYSEELAKKVIGINKESDIVKAQNNADYNILSGIKFENETEKTNIIKYIGGSDIPMLINIFPNDFDSKEQILEYLDKYNKGKTEEEQIIYTDMADTVTGLTNNIMDAITIVLIAFSAISLIVSSIMIGIITYISVLERTKEIGILRSLGARKKDITRVFNAETFIIGLFSGLLGILIARLLLIPANSLLYNLTDLENVAILNPLHAILLIVISMILTLIGGFIPAKMASKKDPVVALRTE